MKSIRLDSNDIYPSKIVCIGRNYVDHIMELGNEVPKEPVFFLKPNSALSDVVCSGQSEVIHFEGEISFVVISGRLAAVGFGLDLTKREIQTRLKDKGLPWERSKAFDRSAVFSQFVSFKGDMSALRLELHIDDQLVQKGGYALMINKPDKILKEATSFLTLEDGDVIMTGTPAGVGPIHPGDRLVGKVFDNETLVVEGRWTVN